MDVKNLKYKHSVQKCHELSLEELFNEKIAVGLRMFSGIKIDDKFYNQIKTKIDFLIKNKLICYLDNVMKITQSGAIVLDKIIDYIINE